MERIRLSVMLFLVFLSAVHFSVASNTTEAEDNTIEVKFYRLQVSEWISGNMESKFHSMLASEANVYCEANFVSCGLTGWDSNNVFKESNIGKVPNSPANDNKDMTYAFNINLPNGVNKSSTSTLKIVLSAPVVSTIVLQVRTKLDYISRLGCSKCYITYIGDDFYGIPQSSLENKILIPIAFLVLIIIVIVAISLYCWEKKKDQERRWQKMNQPKTKKGTIIQPQYVVSSELPKATALPDDQMKERMYAGSVIPKKPVDGYNRLGGASNDSGLDVETYNDNHTQGLSKPNALEPLTLGDQEKKKKKKKEKKHRSKRSTKVDGLENQGYMGENQGYMGGDEGEGEKAEMKTEL